MSVGVRRPGDSSPHPMPGAFVTGNYFTMFGVQPAAGRLLQKSDDRPDAPPVAGHEPSRVDAVLRAGSVAHRRDRRRQRQAAHDRRRLGAGVLRRHGSSGSRGAVDSARSGADAARRRLAPRASRMRTGSMRSAACTGRAERVADLGAGHHVAAAVARGADRSSPNANVRRFPGNTSSSCRQVAGSDRRERSTDAR